VRARRSGAATGCFDEVIRTESMIMDSIGVLKDLSFKYGCLCVILRI